MARLRISAKAERFTESVIREMNRLAVAAGAVSLAQGFPDFPCPPELKAAAAAPPTPPAIRSRLVIMFAPPVFSVRPTTDRNDELGCSSLDRCQTGTIF